MGDDDGGDTGRRREAIKNAEDKSEQSNAGEDKSDEADTAAEDEGFERFDAGSPAPPEDGAGVSEFIVVLHLVPRCVSYSLGWERGKASVIWSQVRTTTP